MYSKEPVFKLKLCCLKKNMNNASRSSEHPPVRGGGDAKTFRWDHKLQRQNLSSWHLNGLFTDSSITSGQLYNVWEKLNVIYCTLTLIAMQVHQTKQNKNNVVPGT